MYIKEIKINGFKSFADKVNLELNKNFTGIVGPNGSGKSNIVDALKWVMGEQSVKTLRGSESMTDVIFNGSAKREGSRTASVSLVLDNTDKTIPVDYTEIEIKRIVYKTGENEYYINKEKVRLKDITNMFIDSFSSKESLSIIPQGKISEILSERPEERRSIIEEAAGVVKYKNRKNEALKKLAKTNENIERVDMIIDELSLQVGPLEEQAQKAKIYKENKEKLESIEIALLGKDIASLNEEFNITKKEKEELNNSLLKTTTENTEEQAHLESMKLERTKLDEEISNSQKELMTSSSELNELSNELELLKERSKYDRNTTEIQESLNKLKENEYSKKAELENYNLKLENLIKEKEELDNKLTNTNEEYKKISTKGTTLSTELESLTRKKYELSNKKDIIEYNIENMSKTPYAVKNILNNPNLSGILNIIGNVINTKEEYALAIDTALGAASSYIITENDTSAKEAINYLKRNKKGRATFYPLNIIKPKSIDEETLRNVKSMPGFIGYASTLVTYDNKYSNIISNTLGNILVADNIDNALIISKKINSRYRFVTLDGEVIHVGGSLTGGSIKDTTNTMASKTELDNINKDLKLLISDIENKEIELKEISNNLEKIKESIYNYNFELVSKKEELEICQKSKTEKEIELDKIINEIKSLSNNGDINIELENLLKEYHEKEKEKNTLEINVNNLENKRKNLISDIEDKELILNKYLKDNKDIEEKIKTLEIKETKLSMTLDSLLNRLNEEYSMTFERARNNYELSMDENDARIIIKEIKNTLKNLGEINLSSIDEFERINKRYSFLTNQKEDLMNSEKNLLSIINDMDDVMIDKFATTFKKVNIEFGKVFKDLFGGGEAHLELTDPTNLLETGINIIANPAGKKPGSLSLLSGGEKTLTAISLLFAIMNLKNVPFVILDEVESALDEVNVERFGEYINSYKGKTQLLIITHKKKTMEYVDLLYGITMEESGVSKFVSVKLEDIK